MGHTDVVPVNPDGWQRDPFGGEVVDGEVWGRGAVDMLNLTATMAVAFRDLARSRLHAARARSSTSRSPTRRTSARGAPSTSLEHERDAVHGRLRRHRGGRLPDADARAARACPVIVGEKGSYWCRITVRGTPGHASQPFRTDNALVTAAEVVRRLAEYRPPTQIHDTWRRFIEGVDFGPEWNAAPARRGAPRRLLRGAADRSRAPGARVHAHDVRAHDHPRRHEDERDPRPRRARGRHPHAARSARAPTSASMLDDALGDLAAHVEITPFDENESTSSPADTPLWDAMGRVSTRLVEGSALVPFLTVGATDARFFRRAGSVAYGFGLFSRKLSFDDYASMFHGNDERVDIESLVLRPASGTASPSDLLGCALDASAGSLVGAWSRR